MEQQELRDLLNKHLEEYGTTLQFIGNKIGVHRSTISLFKNNKRKLADKVAEKLEKYLKSYR